MVTTDVMLGAFWVITPFVFVFGAAIGSFLNVVIWRLPRRESLVHPPSHCPKCNYLIRPWENIPIISWLALRGRCSNCRAPISMRYPVVEALTAVLFLSVWFRACAESAHPSVLPGYFYLAGALVAVSIIDVECRLIPNKITYPGIVLAILLAVVLPLSRPLLGGGYAGQSIVMAELLRHLPQSVVTSVRVTAVLDALSGAAFGGLFLWVFLEIGKLAWGHRRFQLAEPAELTVDATGIAVEGAFSARWDELFTRRRDRLTAQVTGFRCGSGAAGSGGGAAPEAGTLVVMRDRLQLGTWQVPLQTLTSARADVTAWRVPREVLGWGDVKLLAMIGAFVGAAPVLFIVMLGALTGVLVGGGAHLLVPRTRACPIPFGPFLAVGALAWIFAGPELADAYARLLSTVLQGAPPL